MAQDQPHTPHSGLVAVYYHDGIWKGWLGRSNWFTRLFGQKHSIFSKPQLIDQDTARQLRSGFLSRDPGCTVEIWELSKTQNL